MEQTPGKPTHTIRIYDDPDEDLEDDLRPEYDFDRSKARPNPYAARALQRRTAKESEQELLKE